MSGRHFTVWSAGPVGSFLNPFPQYGQFFGSDALTDGRHGFDGSMSRPEVVGQEALAGLSGDDEGAQSTGCFGFLAIGEAHAAWQGGAIVAHGALGFKNRFDMLHKVDGTFTGGGQRHRREGCLANGSGFGIGRAGDGASRKEKG